MSAFYDIWIGNDAPRSCRKGNPGWQQHAANTWLSLPETDKGFLQKTTDGKYNMIFIGQLYEELSYEEVLNRCVRFIDNTEVTFDDPAGHYIIFINDNEHTHVFTNRLGSYHAYWSDDNIISTYYLGLARSKRTKQLDWEGVTGFMGMGYFPGNTTYLKGISILEPASYYRFDSTLGLEHKVRYQQWCYEPVEHKTEYYTEHLHDILRSSLSVAVNNRRTAIPISGGLDSRLLVGELTSKPMTWKDLQAFSYGYTESSPETEIARQIAVQRDIPIHTYVMPDYLFSQLDEITEAVELFQYVDGTRQASAKSWLQQNSDVVIGGHWGDVWMDNMHVEGVDDLPVAFKRKIVKKGSDWLLENICRPQLNNPEGYLQDYFTTFIRRHSDIQDADFLMKIYKTDQWSFRWTAASLRMYQAASMPVLPFYDKRIVELFCTVPTEVVKDRSLEITYLKQYHNDLSRIKWQEYDADLYNYKYFNNRNIAYRAVKKVQRILSKERTIQRNWEVFYLNPEGRKNLESKLLHSRHLEELVPQAKVKALLDDLYRDPTAANGYTVSMLLTFVLFLDKIFEA